MYVVHQKCTNLPLFRMVSHVFVEKMKVKYCNHTYGMEVLNAPKIFFFQEASFELVCFQLDRQIGCRSLGIFKFNFQIDYSRILLKDCTQNPKKLLKELSS